MLYESTYNQYFLEHSWGPWKKHMYISRDGESGRYTYKYPKEYYDKYRNKQLTGLASAASRTTNSGVRNVLRRQYQNVQGMSDADLGADKDSRYYNEYYNDVDKVINRSVKAAVKALNFGLDMKDKAEDYLNRFGNAVADAWTKTKSAVSSYVSTGKNYVSNLASRAASTVTSGAQRAAASVKNLIKGAGEAISKGWEEAKEKANKVSNAASEAKKKLKNKIDIAKARASGGTLV